MSGKTQSGRTVAVMSSVTPDILPRVTDIPLVAVESNIIPRDVLWTYNDICSEYRKTSVVRQFALDLAEVTRSLQAANNDR